MSKQLLIYKHWHEETKREKTKNVAEAVWDPNSFDFIHDDLWSRNCIRITEFSG